MKILILTMFAAGLFSFHTFQEVTSISQIKAFRKMYSEQGMSSRRYIVEGYFYKDPAPLLLSNPRWSRINTRMPDSVYLVLGGGLVEQLSQKASDYQGRLLRVCGTINSSQNSYDFIPLSLLNIVHEQEK